MSQLESQIAASGEAPLPDVLDFSLPPASTAVVDRRQHVRAYPTSASSLSVNGTRTVRIRLGGDDFVDPHSVRLQFTIKNESNQYRLITTGGPWCFWGQVYLRSGGCQLDDIPSYGRFHSQYLYNQLSMQEQYGEAAITGLHGSWATNTDAVELKNRPSVGSIPPSGQYTVMHKLGLSVLSQGRMIPTRYMPLEVELTLNPTITDYLVQGANNSGAFSLQNIQLLYTSYSLDESVVESFYRSLLMNKVLSMPTMTVFQVVQNIPAGSTSFTFSAVRAFSRLSHVWLTFRGTGPRSTEFLCPTETPVAEEGGAPALYDTAPSARLSIGPHYWPDPQPVSTFPELFYQLQQALPGVPNITRDNYMHDCFTIVFDCRKMISDPSSSISTRSGDLVTLFLQNLTANRAQEVWLTCFAFSVTAVRESGVTLLT